MEAQMKKYKGFILLIVLSLLLLFTGTHFADVGDFEDYSYDSDWGGSSWDYDSSDYSYYGGSSGGSSSMSGGEAIIVLVIVVLFILFSAKSGKGNISNYNYGRPVDSTHPKYNAYNHGNGAYIRNEERSHNVASRVQEVDQYFNESKFLTWAKDIYIKLQNAWSERNWEVIRPFESEELFETHHKQLQGYIDRGQINKLERISVNYGELVSFSQDSEKDTLVVALNSSMIDYIINANTGSIIKGDNMNRRTNTYKLTFTRKKGVKTEEGTGKLKTTNCPNCGAPTTITSSGKCEYCNSVITIGSHDWVLTDLERY
jgi:predicted lipid-binding transport protein (Tim44 family)